MSEPCLLGRWCIPAEATELASLRHNLQAAITAIGVEEAAAGVILLAVDEACANIIRHGYHNRPGETLEVAAFHDKDINSLIFQLLDYAPPVGAAKISPRELADVRPGGLGVYFIRQIMDAVDYLPPPPGYGNCLRLAVQLGKTFAWEEA